MIDKITEFKGIHRYLSNFWPSPMIIDRIKYPTVEHAFQAHKFSSSKKRREFSTDAQISPGKVKKLGQGVGLRSDWERVKIPVMKKLVRIKFQQPDLKRALLSTGNRHLEEGNCWYDTFWGVCKGAGENHLGKILMEVRKELKNENR